MEHKLVLHRTDANTLRAELDGKPLTPARSLKVRNHSPTGFNAGYAGSGPAQLALAVLLRLQNREDALDRYQEFKIKHLSNSRFLEVGVHEITFELDGDQ